MPGPARGHDLAAILYNDHIVKKPQALGASSRAIGNSATYREVPLFVSPRSSASMPRRHGAPSSRRKKQKNRRWHATSSSRGTRVSRRAPLDVAHACLRLHLGLMSCRQTSASAKGGKSSTKCGEGGTGGGQHRAGSRRGPTARLHQFDPGSSLRQPPQRVRSRLLEPLRGRLELSTLHGVSGAQQTEHSGVRHQQTSLWPFVIKTASTTSSNDSLPDDGKIPCTEPRCKSRFVK